jgi:hypothetical protein
MKPSKRIPLIGLIAPCMGSGKTTIANELVRQHDYTRLSFADTGKDMVGVLLGAVGMSSDDIQDHLHGARKNTSIAALSGTSVRHLMQTLGTEWGRKCIHPQIWADIGLKRGDRWGRPVFDDVRFLNEAVGIRLKGGFIVRVIRSDAVRINNHASEGLLDDFEADLTITNDGPIEGIPALTLTMLRALGL